MLSLPVASANVAPATEIDPVPDCVFVVGVNTTEYTVDEVVVSVPMLPPEMVMSPEAKSDDASDSVNVTVSVCPDFKEPELARVMVTVGAAVSKEIESALDATLSLPSASVNVAPAIEIEPVPVCVFVVGVNVAVYEVPLPERLPIEPPVVVMSVATKFVDVSESVNVMVSVWPDLSDPEPARVMVAMGAAVS